MYSIGQQVITRPEILGEIISVYPQGQSGAKENLYDVMVNGAKIKIKESDLSLIFSTPKPKKETPQ